MIQMAAILWFDVADLNDSLLKDKDIRLDNIKKDKWLCLSCEGDRNFCWINENFTACCLQSAWIICTLAATFAVTFMGTISTQMSRHPYNY